MDSSENTPSKVMREDEAERFVLQLLSREGPRTTRQIELAASDEKRRCPDQTVLFLAKMRAKGLIDGEPSTERKGWLWSLPA